MKDIRRLSSVRFLQVRRRLFAVSKPGIDIQGQLGNGGEAEVALEYGGEILSYL